MICTVTKEYRKLRTNKKIKRVRMMGRELATYMNSGLRKGSNRLREILELSTKKNFCRKFSEDHNLDINYSFQNELFSI